MPLSLPNPERNTYERKISISWPYGVLAALCGTEVEPVMLLASNELLVVPVTIHEPIANVTKILNESLLKRTILIANSALKTDFSINKPALGVSPA